MAHQENFLKKCNVSRETIQQLLEYEVLLKKWTQKINLIAKSTVDVVWDRHFIDSAQVFSAIPAEARSLVDFGSGGGFPGLVVAILAAEKRPKLSVSLVESDVRKAAFLLTAVRELKLDVTVYAKRVENLKPLGADVITARALASLEDLLTMSSLHLAEGGVSLFLKGVRHQEELDTAATMWDFDMDRQESWTNPGSALLAIRNLRQRS